MTRSSLATLLGIALVVAACGSPGGSLPPGSGAPGQSQSGAAACPVSPAVQGTPEGWDVAAQSPSVLPQVINPAGSVTCGRTRLMFSFIDASNKPIAAPDLSVTVRLFDLGADPAKPVAEAEATFIWAIDDVRGVYVADVDIPTAGTYGAEFTTAAAGGAPEVIRTGFDVQPDSTVIGIGDKAPASQTPTLADVGGDVSRISTDPSPVEAFYETSIADAVAAKEPFVVAFATPKFCKSQQCGPTMDRLKPIAAAHPDVTVINVEPYQLDYVDGALQPVVTGDPPNLTPTAVTREWGLPTEPWVFVVDRNGVVTHSFLLIFSEAELEAAFAAVT